MTEVQDRIAAEVVRAAAGFRWTWPPVRALDRYPMYDAQVALGGRPVTEIHSITVGGTAVTGSDFRLINTYILEIPARRNRGNYIDGAIPWWSCYSGPVDCEVDFTYGSEPPEMAQEAARLLAAELSLASTGAACRLPERVTSVSRQGISFDLLDPQDFLDKGQTGIYEVDLILSALNRGGKARQRARVFSPHRAPPERLRVGDPT